MRNVVISRIPYSGNIIGKLYLVNLGIPKNIYKEVGIKFSSPFGAKFVIPLHDA